MKTIKEHIGDFEISPVLYEPNPWDVPRIYTCKFRNRKEDYHPMELRNIHIRHCNESHSDSIWVYTDASKTVEGVGAAVTIPSKSLQDDAKLNKYYSIYSAELIAIDLALNLIDKCPWDKYTIFTDSQSAIKAIPSYNPKTPLLRKIQEWLIRIHSKRKRIRFCWVPGHTLIRGNELADQIAKATANSNKPIRNYPMHYKDLVPVVKTLLKANWQQEWDRKTNNKLHSIKPRLAKWDSSFQKSRIEEVALCRLRIGHTRLTKSHLMEKENPPVCHFCANRDGNMHHTMSVVHIFSNCSGTLSARRNFFPRSLDLDEEERPRFIFAESEHFNLERIIKFLKVLDLLKEI